MRFFLPGYVRPEMCRDNQGRLVHQQGELREHAAAVQVGLGQEAEALRHDGFQGAVRSPVRFLDLRYLRNPVITHPSMVGDDNADPAENYLGVRADGG
jgi:hypothetical protein